MFFIHVLQASNPCAKFIVHIVKSIDIKSTTTSPYENSRPVNKYISNANRTVNIIDRRADPNDTHPHMDIFF